jgi:plasmid stabilization system protein ParE
MGLTIFWTETARMQLQNIFNYYRDNVSLKVAQKLRNQIYNRTNQLEMLPKSGPIEPLLYRRDSEYR